MIFEYQLLNTNSIYKMNVGFTAKTPTQDADGSNIILHINRAIGDCNRVKSLSVRIEYNTYVISINSDVLYLPNTLIKYIIIHRVPE